jgi:serine phosphatase RsbU (regulator of sigma subunit)
MLPLFYRAKTQEWSCLQDFMPAPKKVSDHPLGLIRGTDYHQTAARLAPGDLLILYTDGINETENEAGDQLGLECLLSMARALAVCSGRLPAKPSWRL